MSRRRLGRGLAALIPDDLMDARSSRPTGMQTVPLTQIGANPEQPRTHFDSRGLQDLASSIREHGVLSPLIVMPNEQGGYQLIAGERRLRAASLAGLDEVPVLVHEGAMAPEVQLELALVENLQREDLDPIEAARGYARLQLDFGYTQEQIAARVGKERSTIANQLRLLRLPDRVLKLVREGRLSTGHAKALLPIEDQTTQRSIVAQVLARGLSVRATEQLVRSRLAIKRRAVGAKGAGSAVKAVSGLLARELQTGVEVKPRARGEGGKIVISYYSGEELERLIKILRSGVER